MAALTQVAEILSPHVEQLVVTHVSESRGQKDDERDAFALAEKLRNDGLQPCRHISTLRLAMPACGPPSRTPTF